MDTDIINLPAIHRHGQQQTPIHRHPTSYPLALYPSPSPRADENTIPAQSISKRSLQPQEITPSRKPHYRIQNLILSFTLVKPTIPHNHSARPIPKTTLSPNISNPHHDRNDARASTHLTPQNNRTDNRGINNPNDKKTLSQSS